MKYLLLALCLYSVTIQAKTTYLARYQNYIHIIENGDTVIADSFTPQLEMTDRDNSFRISIAHETIDKEKVKAIKRAKRTAGWMAASAAFYGTSAAFSTNNLQRYVRSSNSGVAAELAGIYANEALQEQHLKVEMWIENMTSSELMVCDMERGQTWYLQPHQGMNISIHNPDVSCLRISDIHNQRIKFATIAAGSITKKYEIKKEDGAWLLTRDEEQQADGVLLHNYHWINTETYERIKTKPKDYYMESPRPIGK